MTRALLCVLCSDLRIQLTDLLETAEQGTPLLSCEAAQNFGIELIDEPEHIVLQAASLLRGHHADAAAVVGVHHTVNESPLLHAVKHAGDGGVLQSQNLGDLLGRTGAVLPQTAEHTILARSDVKLGQTSGKGLEYLMLRRGQKVVDTILQFHVTNHLCLVFFLKRAVSPLTERLPHLPEPFFSPGATAKIHLDSKVLYHTKK